MTDNYTPPTFDQIIKDACEIVLSQGYHIPTVFAVGTRNTAVIAIAEMPGTHDERRDMMYVLGYKLSRAPIGQLRNVIFVFESWMSFLPPGETEMRVMPSEDPNRVEILALSHFIVRGHRHEMVAVRMIRDQNGNLVDLVTAMDTRNEDPSIQPESGLMDGFLQGYHAGRKGKIPPIGGIRG